NYTVICKIKFATCSLQGNALTWWNSYVKTVTHKVGYAMPCKTLKKMMTDKYCPRGNIKKHEIEMWNLNVKGTDVKMTPKRTVTTTTTSVIDAQVKALIDQIFVDALAERNTDRKSDEIEKYVGGLPNMIHESVIASNPKTRQDAIKFATGLMEKKISTLVERLAGNKRKLDNNNQAQQQPPKKQDRSRNSDDNHDSGTGLRRQAPVSCECTYNDFLKCQPLNFKGAEGVAGLTQCLQGNALTWWNSYVKTVTHKVGYAMPCKTLKKMMTDKYCPRGNIKKHEIEMWNLNVKGTDVVSYNQRFQKLALMCNRMFPEESDEIEKYVGGLPNMIHESVIASNPKTRQDAIKFATGLMEKKISTLVERLAGNKRKLDNNNQAQQQPPKKQGEIIAYTVGPGERKEYAGTLPLCNKCKFHQMASAL
nr:hypothetical protein [Tanacetum cinerariifolium]